MRPGLAVAVAQLDQARTCGCAICRRDAEELLVGLIGRRVRWAWASDAGTVMRILDVADGAVRVSACPDEFVAVDLVKEVPMTQV